MDVNNVFDDSNLPAKIRKHLKNKGSLGVAASVLELFKLKDTLSIDEVVIGMYKKNKKLVARHYVSAILFNLSKKHLIANVGHGIYKLKTNIS